MNCIDFNKECIDYVNSKFKEFTESKDILKEVLKAFHMVCEKNNIRYYLAFGSLLGCIRDNLLMPPWDRDIDVVIFYEDCDKLINALKRDLDPKYSFECDKIVNNFPYYQMHVFPKGLNSFVYHIDVFYLVSSVNKYSDIERWKKKTKKLFTIRKRKYSKIPDNLNRKMYFLFKIYRLFYSFYPKWLLNLRFKQVVKHYDGDYCGIIGNGAEIFPISIFGEGTVVDCENVTIRIPNNPEKFLSIRYGNYIEYLPVSERFEEFMIGSNLLNFFDK